jgi:hypothetical protein
MPKKTCKPPRPKELVKWMSPRDRSLTMKWNSDYQEDLKILNSISTFDPDLVRRQQSIDIQKRMKAFGLWPPGNIKVPAVNVVPYRRTLGKKNEAGTVHLKRNNRFVTVEIDITANQETIF